MRFRLSPDGHIIRTHHEPSVTDTNAMVFASEPEFRKLAAGWPMKRLVEIWNQLPGVRPVQRFESRDTAVARIWRAISARNRAECTAVPMAYTESPSATASIASQHIHLA
jgi:hypothetical protein